MGEDGGHPQLVVQAAAVLRDQLVEQEVGEDLLGRVEGEVALWAATCLLDGL